MVDRAAGIGRAAELLQQARALELGVDRGAVERGGEVGLDARLVDASLVVERVGAVERAVAQHGQRGGDDGQRERGGRDDGEARAARGRRGATAAPPAAQATSTGIG